MIKISKELLFGIVTCMANKELSYPEERIYGELRTLWLDSKEEKEEKRISRIESEIKYIRSDIYDIRKKIEIFECTRGGRNDKYNG